MQLWLDGREASGKMNMEQTTQARKHSNRQILVVEDNRDMAELLVLHLKDLNCDVDWAPDGLTGLDLAQSTSYNLIILDLMLPGLDGLEICHRLRNRPPYVPILMLTAKSAEIDRVLGLEIGADDYLTKPFSIRELLARVKAIFRRVEALRESEAMATCELLREIEIAAKNRTVTVAGKVIELTPKEFDLLNEFARNPGFVYSRSTLLDKVWGYGHVGYEHTVNSHINRLRAKIERDPRNPEYILTVWGVGYKFAADPVP